MRLFGQTASGVPVLLYTLTNAHGLQTEITNYGGIMTRLLVPDRESRLADVVLGYDTLKAYQTDSPYFGAIIGRVGNRIAHGKFMLEGTNYALATNNSPGGIPCHLHGGQIGFDKIVWQAEPVVTDNGAALKLRYLSRDGEEGYPGNLDVTVWYRLTNQNEMIVEYQATTDRTTPVNLTNHNYYNLAGEGSGDVTGHVLTLPAARYTPVNAGLIPSGPLASVAGTPFDFTRPTSLGAHLKDDNEQLRFGAGYDHNFVIDRQAPGLALAAVVHEPRSGRRMEVWTEEPGVQLYSGNYLNAAHIGKSGRPYVPNHGFCLETQHFPDALNHPGFASIVLRPGEVYRTKTVHRFSAA